MSPPPRTAGPLPVSPSLVEALAVCDKAIPVLPADALADYAKPAPLRAESVEWIERTLDARLPDEILALIAMGHPVAAIATGITGLDAILDAAEEEVEPYEGKQWLRVSHVYSEPFMEILDGSHGGPYRSLCVQPGGSSEAGVDVLLLQDDHPVQIDKLGRLLCDIVSEELLKVDAETTGKRRRARAPRFKIGKPRIIDDRGSQAAAGARQRVRHSKFGEGVVIERDKSGSEERLVVEFAEVGVKKLLARFVEQL